MIASETKEAPLAGLEMETTGAVFGIPPLFTENADEIAAAPETLPSLATKRTLTFDWFVLTSADELQVRDFPLPGVTPVEPMTFVVVAQVVPPSTE